MENTFVIAGLGNPGARYARTRHNVGFMVVDRIAEMEGASFRASRGNYVYASVPAFRARLLLVKPLSFMNLSGGPVRQALDYWKVPLEQLLVVYDDLALPFGKLRLRSAGSDGGHKGMRSIITSFGTESISRLRIGIGRENVIEDAADFVLTDFSKDERTGLPEVLQRAVEAIEVFVRKGITEAMNQFNG